VETAMNVENIPAARPPAESRPTTPVAPVIQLEEIQSIVYLGVKGQVLPAESHRVDTFA
jgi:hypothetical protein